MFKKEVLWRDIVVEINANHFILLGDHDCTIYFSKLPNFHSRILGTYCDGSRIYGILVSTMVIVNH